MNYNLVAKKVLESLGGKENIATAAHCATRLRLTVKDDSLVDKSIIDEIDEVKGYFLNNNQHQFILGSGIVNNVFAEFAKLTGIKEMSTSDVKASAGKKQNKLLQFVMMLSDIFVPIIPAIVAGGLLMGLNNILTATGLFYEGQSLISAHPGIADLANLINTFANAPFVFLPILIAFSATKKFGGNPFLGAALGMLMVHPDLLNGWGYGAALANNTIPTWNILGFTIEKVGYQGTVFPILGATYALSVIEKRVRKIMPSTLDNLLTPLFTLFFSGILTFVAIGPLLRWVGNVLTSGIMTAYHVGGPLGGGLFGLIYAPFVITGMHHSFIAVETKLLADMAVTGGTFIFVIASMSNVAQGGACLAASLTTKDKKLKSISVAAGISALLGITEPAMFGVNLKLRYPFLGAIIGSGVASMFVTYKHVLATALGAAGIPGIISIKIGFVGFYVIGLIISIVVSFILTILFSKSKKLNK